MFNLLQGHIAAYYSNSLGKFRRNLGTVVESRKQTWPWEIWNSYRACSHNQYILQQMRFVVQHTRHVCKLPHVAAFRAFLRQLLWLIWMSELDNLLSVDKKNQLDVTFCILYFSSNSCSTRFEQPCAHHQELTTAWCYSLVLVCAVAAGRLSRLLYSLFLF